MVDGGREIWTHKEQQLLPSVSRLGSQVILPSPCLMGTSLARGKWSRTSFIFFSMVGCPQHGLLRLCVVSYSRYRSAVHALPIKKKINSVRQDNLIMAILQNSALKGCVLYSSRLHAIYCRDAYQRSLSSSSHRSTKPSPRCYMVGLI